MLKILSLIVLTITAPNLLAENFEKGQKWPGKTEASYSGASMQSIQGSSLKLCGNQSGADLPRFKLEEGNLTDVQATQKLCEAILKLNEKVTKEWGKGVVLRITEAYDQDGEHSKFSLHNEGRAADMTTSDKDPKKLGRLAYLASQSGFSWVYYETNHVHASVKK